MLSGTRLDLRKKVKNATKNKAHIAGETNASSPDLTKDVLAVYTVDYKRHSIPL